MQYTKLGNTDIEVSKLCLGCMSFGKAGTMHGWTLDESDSDAVIKHAIDLGINFFDTANCYSAGTGEEYLGKALKNYIHREKAVIASKVYFNEGRLSKAAIDREIDGTLKRLGTDYLARTTWESDNTLRGKTDNVVKGKYDRTEQQDIHIVHRAAELAEKYGCKISQIAVAWEWKKGVAAPIVGATKSKYLDDAAGALDIVLTDEDMAYLEELYVPHPIVGAIDKNPPQGTILVDEKSNGRN